MGKIHKGSMCSAGKNEGGSEMSGGLHGDHVYTVVCGGWIMVTNYTPKKDVSFGLAMFLCPLAIWVVFLFVSHISLFLIASIVSLLFLSIWFGTAYQIRDGFFYCRSPFRKKIPINRITKMDRKVRSWSGYRPALTFEYLRIEYNQYDELFVGLENEEGFIKEIMKINPEIEVV